MISINRKIITNIFWMVFDKIFFMVIGLLVTLKVANHFAVDEYGVYQYVISAVAILEAISNFIDGRVVKKKYIDTDPDVLVFNVTICRIALSFGAFAIGIVVALISEKGKIFNIVFFIMMSNMLIVNLKYGMINRFEYLLQSKKVVIAGDIATLISFLLQILVVYYNGSIVDISIITVIASIINLSIIIVQYNRTFKDRHISSIDWRLNKELFLESVPLALAAMCAMIYQRCDSLMIGDMLSLGDVAIYSISLKLISVVQIAIVPIRESIYPKLIELHKNNYLQYEKMYIKTTSILTWIYIGGVAFSFWVVPYLIHFLKSDYSLAFPVYKIYVLGTLFMYNAALRAGHFTLIKKGKILTVSQSISVALNIVFNYLLILKYGIYGAALATVITQGCSLMASNLFFGKEGRRVFLWQIKAFNPMNIFLK